ncbi:MAG: HD domain-containing protein [Minisyncoccia bacterium]
MAKKTKGQKQKIYEQIVNFFYETGIHSKTPRSGFWPLGSGSQSVADHLFHTAMIAYALAYLEPKADKSKIVLMALFHDIGEGRTSDLNYIHQRYGRLAEVEAVKDMSKSIPFGPEILGLFEEEQAKETLEARLVKDADNLEWIVTLRGEEVKGNIKATKWIKQAVKRLKTAPGKELGRLALQIDPDFWWFNVNNKWFVNREEKYKKWDSKKRK